MKAKKKEYTSLRRMNFCVCVCVCFRLLMAMVNMKTLDNPIKFSFGNELFNKHIQMNLVLDVGMNETSTNCQPRHHTQAACLLDLFVWANHCLANADEMEPIYHGNRTIPPMNRASGSKFHKRYFCWMTNQLFFRDNHRFSNAGFECRPQVGKTGNLTELCWIPVILKIKSTSE